MSERLFTPEEVDGLIPKLSELVETAMDRHRQATALQHQLHEAQERVRISGGTLVDRRDWKARAERLDGLAIEVRAVLREINAMGGVVKDLDLGLVDFPGLVHEIRGDEAVNLCWKHGEARVGFWHGFDEGYAQRKPLP
ncbi:MAG TPA: DUF2203 domain-containing protein [Methylomirabilota bacterium]|nr:DUF2203 domain-containing protein [Methylomirabilota bacterium]